MNTLEMLNEAEKTGKTYKLGDLNYCEDFGFMFEDGSQYKHKFTPNEFMGFDCWSEIKKEHVDFITAIKSDKRIRPSYKIVFNPGYNDVKWWLRKLSMEIGYVGENQDKYIDSKWYIED